MRHKLIWFLLVAVIVTALDLFTKVRAFAFLPGEGQQYEVIEGTFWLAHHRNTGGMWGIGQDWNPWILRSVRILAVAVIFVILGQTAPRDRLSIVALGLVLGGAIGNIYDSLAFGYVRDFLKFDFGFPPFHPFPTFNVADSAICVGVALLAVQMLRAPERAASRQGGSAAAPTD